MLNKFENIRFMWASSRCREDWQQVFKSMPTDWVKTQILSVVEGIRPGMWEFVPESRLKQICEDNIQLGLSVVPLGYYPNNAVRIYVGKQPSEFQKAYMGEDIAAVGSLLGYPDCCIEWFNRIWKEPLTDPTLYMENHDGPFTANILLRQGGVRYVPHLPCKGDCEASVSFGESFREITSPEMRIIKDEILKWPVRWSALHGALEIFLPVCKMQGYTEHTPDIRIVDRVGEVYPYYAPNGLIHPFGGAARALPKGNKPPRRIQSSSNSRLWEHNGFSSHEGMEKSHDPLVASIQTSESDVICDLGAGNGALLSKFTAKRLIGVESDLQRASESLPNIEMYHSKVQQFQIPSDVTIALVAPIRLIEEKSPQLIEQLKKVSRVYIYGYTDTLKQYGSLAKECEAAEMNGCLTPLCKTPEVEVALWKGQ